MERSGETDAETQDEGQDLDKYRHDGPKIDFAQCTVLEREPGVSSGEWLFKGTAIGLKDVLWFLAQNHNLDETVEEFYNRVPREDIAEALFYMGGQLETGKRKI